MMSRFPLLFLLLTLRICGAVQTELTADSLEMVSTEDEARAVCEGNVVLTGTNLKIVCDRLEIIAARMTELSGSIPTLQKFKYLLATGNVRIEQGTREATCGRAEVFPREEKVVLTENPVLVDHASEIWAAGDEITLLRGDQRLHVKNPRVIGPPIKDLGPDARDEKEQTEAKAPSTPPTP
jgi:lipopolysaccharide export system protein LptA